MEKRTYPDVNPENAEEICRRIRADAESQARELVERARKESAVLIEHARQEAERKADEISRLLNAELEKLKDRMISATHLEKKRAIIEEKNKFAEAVIEAVKSEAGSFRNNARYAEFLTKMVMEGARIVGSRTIDVFYSSADEKIVTDEFKSSLDSLAKKEIDENMSFSFKPAEFHDIGVIIQSSDGRLVCDNRFLSRFHAVYDDVYTRLLKEAG